MVNTRFLKKAVGVIAIHKEDFISGLTPERSFFPSEGKLRSDEAPRSPRRLSTDRQTAGHRALSGLLTSGFKPRDEILIRVLREVLRVLGGAALIVTAGCATVNVPNIGQSGYQLEDDERRLKKRTDEIVDILDRSHHIYPDPQLEDYLTQLANQLLPAHIHTENLAIQIKVLQDPSLNAFALPNGRIYIHTGMLAVIENEAQLASLLAHEMTHIIHRHTLKQFRSLINKSAFWMTFQTPIAIAGGDLAGLLAQLTVISSVYGFSRELESEADRQGFEMLLANGYDVREAPKLFEEIKIFIEQEKIKQPFFFSTHPHVVQRIESFKALIEKKDPQEVEGGKIERERYQNAVRRLVLDNIELCLNDGLFKTAERNIHKLMEQEPNSAEAHYYEGELYRQRQDPEKKEKKRDKPLDYPKALEAYEKALALNPQLALAYQGKGRVLQKLGKNEEAKVAFQEYLRLNPQAEDKSYVEQFLSAP
jgi:predicted Zn-dependent protease